MAPVVKNRPYSLLARFYDHLTDGVAEMNRHARREVLGKALDRARVVCDLACGSGETAIELAKRGHDVHAVDSSAVFLRDVREKAVRAGVRVKTHRADMRTFRLRQPVDLLLCEFAALNNLDRRSDLAKVFRCVARALRPGGLFAFDVNTRLAFETQTPRGEWVERKEFKLVIHGVPEDHGLRTPLHLEWFVPERGRYRHVRETIVHVCWTEPEIRRELAKAGFTRIRTFDGADVRPRKMKTPRGTDLYFVAERRA
ncbi:MAG TPA: class I SAM-dependent methyltransferase [Planctomycetota bacterium]|jgi:SAM-dependent methyltransferase|nr:class I SAM-dependent methyltransferase [Planctomycetota bacterium]